MCYKASIDDLKYTGGCVQVISNTRTFYIRLEHLKNCVFIEGVGLRASPLQIPGDDCIGHSTPNAFVL